MDDQYAVVIDGLVDNVVVWDGVVDWDPGEGAVLVKLDPSERVGIGWTYKPKATKNKWVAPPEPEEPTDGAD